MRQGKYPQSYRTYPIEPQNPSTPMSAPNVFLGLLYGEAFKASFLFRGCASTKNGIAENTSLSGRVKILNLRMHSGGTPMRREGIKE